MYDFLKLKKEVSETTADIEGDDVIGVKNKLKSTTPSGSIFGIDNNKEIRDRMYPAIKEHEKILNFHIRIAKAI